MVLLLFPKLMLLVSIVCFYGLVLLFPVFSYISVSYSPRSFCYFVSRYLSYFHEGTKLTREQTQRSSFCSGTLPLHNFVFLIYGSVEFWVYCVDRCWSTVDPAHTSAGLLRNEALAAVELDRKPKLSLN